MTQDRVCALWYDMTKHKHQLHEVRFLPKLFEPCRGPKLRALKRRQRAGQPSSGTAMRQTKILEGLCKPWDELFHERVLATFRSAMPDARLVPPWLVAEEYPLQQLVAEMTYHVMLPLTVAGQLESAKDSTHPGEHMIHPLGVLATGHSLLRSHHVGGRPLWEAVRRVWRKRLPSGSIAGIREAFNCPRALDADCIDFVWQLLAIVHDVGYQSTMLWDCLRSLTTCSCADPPAAQPPVLPVECQEPRVRELVAAFAPQQVASSLAARLGELGLARAGELLKRYTEDVASDNQSYGWWLHAVHGAAAIIAVYDVISKNPPPTHCWQHIYPIVAESVLVHHFPSSSLVEEWRWRFRDNPFAYLLKVVDEVPLSSGTKGISEIVVDEVDLVKRYSITMERRYPYFRFDIQRKDQGPHVREPLSIRCCRHANDRGCDNATLAECVRTGKCSVHDVERRPKDRPTVYEAKDAMEKDRTFRVFFLPKLEQDRDPSAPPPVA